MPDISWVERNPYPTANSLFDLARFPDGLLVAVGQAGTVLKSLDDGANWSRNWLNTQHELRALHVFEDGEGLIGGANG